MSSDIPGGFAKEVKADMGEPSGANYAITHWPQDSEKLGPRFELLGLKRTWRRCGQRWESPTVRKPTASHRFQTNSQEGSPGA